MCEFTPKISWTTTTAPRGRPSGRATQAERRWPSAASSCRVLMCGSRTRGDPGRPIGYQAVPPRPARIIRAFSACRGLRVKLRTPLVLALCAGLAACATPPPAAAPAAPRDAGTELHALFERYFEDQLRLNPLLATYIGDHRYDDRLPNSIGPQYRAEVKARNGRYLDEGRAIDQA